MDKTLALSFTVLYQNIPVQSGKVVLDHTHKNNTHFHCYKMTNLSQKARNMYSNELEQSGSIWLEDTSVEWLNTNKSFFSLDFSPMFIFREMLLVLGSMSLFHWETSSFLSPHPPATPLFPPTASNHVAIVYELLSA